MKYILSFAGFVIATTLAPMASAMDPAINCLQWKLSTERNFVTKRNASLFAKKISTDMKSFGFKQETTQLTREARSYFFRYDRDAILKNSQKLRDYEDAVFQLARATNSQLGYTFSCSFSAPVPWPRVSGSSSN